MSDNALLDSFYSSVEQTIEDMVSDAITQKNIPAADVAILLERTFDGHVRGGCGRRAGVARRIEADARLPAEIRAEITSRVMNTRSEDIPAVLIVQTEGYLAAGVKPLTGSLVMLS